MPACLALGAACALFTSHPASPLQGYRILIEAHDSLSDALAKALAARGFSVRRRIRGGSAPTAALVTFTFRDSTITWFHARLADTRSGAIVAAVSVPRDSLGPASATQAKTLADSFAVLLRRAPEPVP